MSTGIGLLSLALLAGSANAGPTLVAVADKAPTEAPVPVVTAMTLQEICCCGVLNELPPGLHQITVIHPHTCCPVTICFCLPCGCYDVVCGKGLCATKLRFKYPGLCNDIVIKFRKNGDVIVKD